MLLYVLSVIPTREVALRAHVTVGCVNHWRGGFRRPCPRSRRALETHLQIPAELWDRTLVNGQFVTRRR